jgi:hypothetical protein
MIQQVLVVGASQRPAARRPKPGVDLVTSAASAPAKRMSLRAVRSSWLVSLHRPIAHSAASGAISRCHPDGMMPASPRAKQDRRVLTRLMTGQALEQVESWSRSLTVQVAMIRPGAATGAERLL